MKHNLRKQHNNIQISKKINLLAKNGNGGFTLLMAVITTSLFLIISFMVVNIARKQSIIANTNQESQYAFYSADSGIECATYWDLKGGINPFNPSTKYNVSCGGNTVTPTVTEYVYQPSIAAYVSTSTFTVALTKGCVDIELVKNQNTESTTVNSRGYNNCTAGAQRKFQRGVTITYPSAPINRVPVAWTDVTSPAVASGNNLTTSSATGWGTAGARSTQRLTSGNGYVEYTVGASSIGQMIGLTPDYSGNNYTNIDYAIHIGSTNFVNVFENSVNVAANVSTYVSGDVLKVSVENNQVKYYKNNTLLYTSTVAPTYPLYVDASFNTPVGSMLNVMFGS